MFANLKLKYGLLSNEEKAHLYEEVLLIDRTTFSKKMNGIYTKENFNPQERELIHGYLEEKLKEHIDFIWLFEEVEKESMKLRNSNFDREFPRRFEIAVERAKKLQGITEAKIAEKIGIHKSLIWSYKKGKVKPTLENIDKIAKVLDVNPSFLLAKTSTPFNYEMEKYEELYNEEKESFFKGLNKFENQFCNEYVVDEEMYRQYNDLLNVVLRNIYEYLYYEITLYYAKMQKEDQITYFNELREIEKEMWRKIKADKNELEKYFAINETYKIDSEKYQSAKKENYEWTYRTDDELMKLKKFEEVRKNAKPAPREELIKALEMLEKNRKQK